MSPVLSEIFSIGASLDGRNGLGASLLGDIPVYTRQTEDQLKEFNYLEITGE